jgi:hypothetical protein
MQVVSTWPIYAPKVSGQAITRSRNDLSTFLDDVGLEHISKGTQRSNTLNPVSLLNTAFAFMMCGSERFLQLRLQQHDFRAQHTSQEKNIHFAN